MKISPGTETTLTPPENTAERTVYYFYFGQPIVNNYRVPFYTIYRTVFVALDDWSGEFRRVKEKLIGLITGKYTLKIVRDI